MYSYNISKNFLDEIYEDSKKIRLTSTYSLNSNKINKNIYKKNNLLVSVSPLELKHIELNKTLSEMEDISMELKKSLLSFIINMEKIIYMNTKILAIALLIITNIDSIDTIDSELFKNKYVKKLIVDNLLDDEKDKDNINIQISKNKLDIFRYIMIIKKYLDENNISIKESIINNDNKNYIDKILSGKSKYDDEDECLEILV